MAKTSRPSGFGTESTIDPTFVPHGKLVLVRKPKVDEVTPGGIFLPEGSASSAKRETVEAIVVAIGPDSEGYAVGDRVLMHHLTGNEVTVRGQNFFTCRPEDLIGKFVQPKSK
jgi:co-chaperonin GroES (HSP10)